MLQPPEAPTVPPVNPIEPAPAVPPVIDPPQLLDTLGVAATTEIYPLSLLDVLPIYAAGHVDVDVAAARGADRSSRQPDRTGPRRPSGDRPAATVGHTRRRRHHRDLPPFPTRRFAHLRCWSR